VPAVHRVVCACDDVLSQWASNVIRIISKKYRGMCNSHHLGSTLIIMEWATGNYDINLPFLLTPF